MAVAFDSLCPDTASAANVSSLTSGSWTPAAGAAFGFIGTGAGTPSTHTVMRYGGSGGTALTQVGSTLTVGSFGRLSAWRSTIPAGSTTSYGTWGAAQDESCIGMVSYTGADGTVSAATTNTGTFASSTSFTPTVNVTTSVGDVVIACVWWVDINGQSGAIAAGTGCTSRYDVQGSVTVAEGMMIVERTAAGASTTMSATVTAAGGMSGDWGIIAFVITPSAGGGGGGGTEVQQQLSPGTTRNRPGRGPYSLGQYFRPRVEAFTLTDVTVALTGQALSIARGTLTPNTSVALSGQQLSSAQGTLTPSNSITLTGQALSSAQGTLTPNTSVALSGQLLTIGQGSVSINGDVTLPLTGQALTVSQGALGVSLDKALSGQSLTSAQGALTPNLSVALTGQGLVSAQGTLTGTGGDVVVALTGQSITFSQGVFNIQNDGAPASKGAGSPRRKRRRYYVEINGQEFEVSGAQEAEVLLARTREVATALVEKARAAPVRINRGISRPVIRTSSPELKALVRQARQEITGLYDDLARDLEIRAFMARADEEEEALIRLLM